MAGYVYHLRPLSNERFCKIGMTNGRDVENRLKECYEHLKGNFPTERALLDNLMESENEYVKGFVPVHAVNALRFVDFSSMFRRMISDESMHVQACLVDALIEAGVHGDVHRVMPLFEELNTEYARQLEDEISAGIGFLANNNPLLSARLFSQLANLGAKFRESERQGQYSQALELSYQGEYKRARDIFRQVSDQDVDTTWNINLNDVVTSLHPDDIDEEPEEEPTPESLEE